MLLPVHALALLVAVKGLLAYGAPHGPEQDLLVAELAAGLIFGSPTPLLPGHFLLDGARSGAEHFLLNFHNFLGNSATLFRNFHDSSAIDNLR